MKKKNKREKKHLIVLVSNKKKQTTNGQLLTWQNDKLTIAHVKWTGWNVMGRAEEVMKG